MKIRLIFVLGSSLMLGGCAFTGCIQGPNFRVCGVPIAAPVQVQQAPNQHFQQPQHALPFCPGHWVRHDNGALECRQNAPRVCGQNPMMYVPGRGWVNGGMWCSSALDGTEESPSFEFASKVIMASELPTI